MWHQSDSGFNFLLWNYLLLVERFPNRFLRTSITMASASFSGGPFAFSNVAAFILYTVLYSAPLRLYWLGYVAFIVYNILTYEDMKFHILKVMSHICLEEGWYYTQHHGHCIVDVRQLLCIMPFIHISYMDGKARHGWGL